MRNLSPEERETTVTSTDADDIVRIWSAQRTYITRMRKNPSFTEVRSGHFGSTEWAEFTIPSDQWNPASGAKRRSTLTEEQKRASAERLRALRRQAQADIAAME